MVQGIRYITAAQSDNSFPLITTSVSSQWDNIRATGQLLDATPLAYAELIEGPDITSLTDAVGYVLEAVIFSSVTVAGAVYTSKTFTQPHSSVWLSQQAVDLTQSYVTGTLPIAKGGTGQITQQAAIDVLAGAQSAGTYLRSDGTHTTLSAIVASDVPTLNQNTTGTASNVTGTVAIANGGTGAMSPSGARSNLSARKDWA